VVCVGFGELGVAGGERVGGEWDDGLDAVCEPVGEGGVVERESGADGLDGLPLPDVKAN
jgi:hypothetical protein